MSKLLMALRLIPVVLKAVRSIEEEIPLPKKGKEKLDFVLDVVEKANDTALNVRPIVEPIVNAAVKLFKVTGIFK